MAKIHTSIGKAIRSSWLATLDLLYPPRCLTCLACLDSKQILCDTCAEAIDVEQESRFCPHCAAPTNDARTADGLCPRCRGRKSNITGTVCAGCYTGVLGRMLRAYKYDGQERYESLIVSRITSAVQGAPWTGRLEAVVGVPAHWSRRMVRTLHAADRLADRVARRLDLPKAAVLRRIKGGPKQVGLTYRARLANVRNAFAVKSGVALDGPRLLLIDDVTTTSATLEECARTLVRAGAAEVYAAVFLAVDWDPRPREVLGWA